MFVRLGNTEDRAKLGREVIGATKSLVLSPVVIGIWEPMAKALGWPDKPIGWSDILGFRPGAVEIQIGPPIDIAHGVDPREPKTVLELPNTATVAAIRNLWFKNKRQARVTLMFDVSDNMNDRNKIALARDGALDLLSFMSDADSF